MEEDERFGVGGMVAAAVLDSLAEARGQEQLTAQQAADILDVS